MLIETPALTFRSALLSEPPSRFSPQRLRGVIELRSDDDEMIALEN